MTPDLAGNAFVEVEAWTGRPRSVGVLFGLQSHMRRADPARNGCAGLLPM